MISFPSKKNSNTKNGKKYFQLNQSATRQTGFTLVEVLVALMLSSIIFVSSYQIISNLIQYQVRARIQYDNKVDQMLIKNLLGNLIEKSIHQFDLYQRFKRQNVFMAGDDYLQLLSRAFADRFDNPGFRVYRIYTVDDEIMIGYRKFEENYLLEAQEEVATGLKVSDLEFEYYQQGGWSQEWGDEKSIPEFIRVNVIQPDGGQFEIVRGTGRI